MIVFTPDITSSRARRRRIRNDGAAVGKHDLDGPKSRFDGPRVAGTRTRSTFVKSGARRRAAGPTWPGVLGASLRSGGPCVVAGPQRSKSSASSKSASSTFQRRNASGRRDHAPKSAVAFAMRPYRRRGVRGPAARRGFRRAGTAARSDWRSPRLEELQRKLRLLPESPGFLWRR